MAEYQRAYHRYHQTAPSSLLPIMPWTPSRILSSPPKILPKSWDAYFDSIRPTETQPTALLPWVRVTQSTLSLSMPLTIVQGLERLYGGLDRVNKLESLILHVIGAEDYEINFGGYVFEEILHLLPGIKKLGIIFVGPDWSMEPVVSKKIEGVQCCRECTRKGRRISRIFVQAYYDEWLRHRDPNKGSLEGLPHLVIGFNSGLHSVTYQESWEPALKMLVQTNWPCVFTSFDMREAKLEAAVLEKFGAKLRWKETPNVWAAEEVTWDCVSDQNETLYRVNGFWLGFGGRDQISAF